MRVALAIAAVVGLVSIASGQNGRATASAAPPLFRNLGSYHRAIWTTVPDAQRYFDQGLTLVYAFNHEEAIRSFRRAAELDPKAPMPLWGIAYALGPNINDPGAAQNRMRAACETIERAKTLVAAAPARERAWIDALARRYSLAPGAQRRVLAVDYKDAMADVVARYPDDLDAATLYAEALMDARPWQLWSIDGKPAAGTEEMIGVLESVLRRDPTHPGANHYYIHALEASPFPERALTSAKLLETLVPGAGHLVHMPSHVYMRTGDYAAAAKSNADAARVDAEYIRQTGVSGFYPVAYYAHNLRFLAAAASMAGQYADARGAADELVGYIDSVVGQVRMAEMLLSTRTYVLVRFAKWAEILERPRPPADEPITRAFDDYARAVAYAALGDAAKADGERRAFESARLAIPAGMMMANNPSAALFDLAAHVIDARIAAARGNHSVAIAAWRQAVAAQDALAYSEPPDWYYPVRESLGAALLLANQAPEAERVFREDLKINPGNGRSLFGLWNALTAQERTAQASRTRADFETAWKHADVTLRIRDF